MFRPLVYTTLFATLAAALSIDTPKSAGQCGSLDVSWSGKNGPFDVYLFTGCEDDDDDPLFELLSVEGTNTSIPLPYKAGTTLKVEIYDSKENTAATDEFTLTGDSKEYNDCSKALVASVSQSSVAATATGTTTSVAAAADSVPTTQSVASSRVVPNNAAAGTSSGSDAESTEPAKNGASALLSKPFGFTAGIVLAVSVALSL